MQIVQKLNDNDYETRMPEQFWNLFRTPRMLGNILFSNEAHFYFRGYVNKPNMRYWHSSNKQKTQSIKRVYTGLRRRYGAQFRPTE